MLGADCRDDGIGVRFGQSVEGATSEAHVLRRSHIGFEHDLENDCIWEMFLSHFHCAKVEERGKLWARRI